MTSESILISLLEDLYRALEEFTERFGGTKIRQNNEMEDTQQSDSSSQTLGKGSDKRPSFNTEANEAPS